MPQRPKLLLLTATLALGASACGSSNECAPGAATPASAAGAATAAKQAPSTSSASQPGGAVFHVEIAKDGSLSIEGARVADLKELGSRARASAQSQPDLLVVIAADRDTPFSQVLAVHDVAKQSGFSRVMLAEGRIPPSAAGAPAQHSVPQLLAGDAWKCSISHHVDDLDKKSVFLAIHVGPDGVPQTVDILEDPGFGLGDAARICALNQSFRPARDAKGTPTVGVKKLRLFFQQRN